MPKPVIPIVPPYTPELLPDVQQAIRDHLDADSRIFEYGSGYSTVWFAEMCGVTAVEHDDEWFVEVRDALEREGLTADLRLVTPQNMAKSIVGKGTFDLVLVDCLDERRIESLKAARDCVRAGGWLVLDDSQWPALHIADDILRDWPQTVYDGYHLRRWKQNGEVRYHRTTVYEKPGKVT